MNLNNCRLFSGLAEKETKKISVSSKLFNFQKGEIIFSQGDEAKGFYIIANGIVKIYQLSKAGNENLLHIFEKGESFGEAAAFGEGFFPAFAETMQKSEIIFIPIKEFKELLKDNPSLTINLIASLSKLMHILVDQIESLTLKDAGERLAKFLLTCAKKNKAAKFTLPTNKTSLAKKLNIKQETLSRLFARFQAVNIMKIDGNKVEIKDKESLENLI